LNTRAKNSLAYGPGLLENSVVGSEVEFIIQARNENSENRSSGNDVWEIKITTENAGEEGGKATTVEIPCEIQDRNDGSYLVKYQVDEECETKIKINFLDDKNNFVPMRGSPYTASFKAGGKPVDNTLIGPAM
jgi:dynein heavy chain